MDNGIQIICTVSGKMRINNIRILVGDKVKVLAGKDKGKEGRVLVTLKKKDRVVVEGINIVKKHLKPKNNNGNGEIIEVEAPIHVSNVMLVDPKTKKPTKVKIEKDSKGNKVRISKKSNEKIN